MSYSYSVTGNVEQCEECPNKIECLMGNYKQGEAPCDYEWLTVAKLNPHFWLNKLERDGHIKKNSNNEYEFT